MHCRLVTLIFASLLVAAFSIDRRFFPKNRPEAVRNRSNSLAKLLRKIVNDYFGNCTLGVIYDSDYEHQRHPIDFDLYFGSNAKIALMQETVDISGGEKPRHRRANDKCINYIVFLYNIVAIKYIMDKNIADKIVIVSGETPWEVKDFLKSHSSRFYMHLLIIVHSSSNRKGDGSYLLYTHRLYAEGSGSSQPLLLASWVNDSTTKRNVNLFPEKLRRGFMGHRFLVSAIENPPFSFKRSLNEPSETKWDGFEVRLLKLSAEYLNFTAEFTEPRSTELSALHSVKNDVSLGLTSAAVGGIYQTTDIGNSFDASSSYAEDCASFVSLASTALPKYRAVLGPFQLTVWLFLCAAYIVLILPLSFNSHYSLLSLVKHPSGINNIFWFIFSTYTNSFVVKNPLLEYGIAKNSITILIGIYWVFTIIITACYTGTIVAFITIPVYLSAIENSEELLAYRYRIGTLDHDGWEKWFNVNTTDDPFLQKLFRKMDYVPSVLEGVQNASRAYFWPYAFLASRTVLDYIIQTEFASSSLTKRTLMHISDECFVRYNVVQLFPAKSLYTKSMSGFVSRATETGMIKKILEDIDWEIQRMITKTISRKIPIEDRTLAVEDTQGMFLILGAGILGALLALILELMTHCVQKRQMPGQRADSESSDDQSRRSSRMDSWVVHHVDPSEIRQRCPRGSI